MSEERRGDMPFTPVDFDPFADMVSADVLPLTEPQTEMWIAVQMGDEASCAYNQCFSLTLRGSLSAESMESALRQTMDRHDALRVSINADGEQQQIAASSQIALRVTDLSNHFAQSRAAEIDRILEAETTQPFDLATGPLLRATLVREAADLHRLIVTVHHIVCDGWSSAVLFSDLARIYAADLHGLSAQLPPPSPYRDYIAREAARADDAQAGADEDYWVQQYADSIPVLDLPLDCPRPGTKTYNGGRQELRLDESLYGALKKIGTQHGCTLFVTLLAAFEALLSRLSGQDDFVVGVPMTGQALLDNSHLVGHCVNMIPLRCRIEPAARFVDHLKSVRHTFLDAQSHQQLTFGSLVRRLNVPRDPARTPLVSVTFNIDKIGAPFDFGDLALESVESPPKRFVNFEISINVLDTGRNLLLECGYNTDLFTSATIERWLGHYKVLLEAIASGAEQLVGELPLLRDAERRQLLVEWNDTATDYPADALLHTLIEAQAAHTPDAVAVVFEDQRLTYCELDARTNQLAHHLQKRGVGPDTLVPICVERSLEMVVGLLGILKAGGAYVPIDPTYPKERLTFMLEDSKAPVLITESRLKGTPLEHHANRLLIDKAEAFDPYPTTNPKTATTSDNLAYVIYTSGSTGTPKGVAVTHRSLSNYTEYICAKLGLKHKRLAFATVSTLSADLGNTCIFPSLVSGGCLHVLSYEVATNAALFAEYVSRYPIDVLKIVPLHLKTLLDSEAAILPREYLILGGEASSWKLIERIAECGGSCHVINHYGPTETTVGSLTFELDDERPPAATVPIGRPIANTEVYVLDPHRNPVPIGVAGELYIGGAGLARGYLNRPELTAEKFIANPFGDDPSQRLYKTGDLARYLPDGNIEFLGRIDNQVKIRGFRIELGEIEANLAEHPDVRQAAVHLWTVKADDARIVACCVPAKAGVLSPISLRKHLRARLPEYMVPQYFLPVDEIPLTPNGKVDRRRLPIPVVAESRIGRHEAPSDPIEATIAEIWTQLIHPARPISRMDKFFEMGGHSLLGINALRQIENKLGVRLEFRVLFQESLADIATRCRSEIAGKGGQGRGKA